MGERRIRSRRRMDEGGTTTCVDIIASALSHRLIRLWGGIVDGGDRVCSVKGKAQVVMMGPVGVAARERGGVGPSARGSRGRRSGRMSVTQLGWRASSAAARHGVAEAPSSTHNASATRRNGGRGKTRSARPRADRFARCDDAKHRGRSQDVGERRDLVIVGRWIER